VLTDLQKMGNGTMKVTFEVDGEPQEFTARALTLSDLIAFEGEVCPLAEFEANDAVKLSGLRFLLWRILRRSAPDLTEEATGDLFAVEDLPRVEELVGSFFPTAVAAAEAAAATS
jgi:hypothetical protein